MRVSFQQLALPLVLPQAVLRLSLNRTCRCKNEYPPGLHAPILSTVADLDVHKARHERLALVSQVPEDPETLPRFGPSLPKVPCFSLEARGRTVVFITVHS